MLEHAISALDVSLEVPDVFSVHGYGRIIEEAERLSRTAQKSLLLSGWPRELETLREALEDASKRSVSIVIFSHAHLPPELMGTHFSYGLDEPSLEAFWKHRLVVVADDRRTLIGATERAASDNAVISETEAIAELATSQIALDITLLAQRHRWNAQGAMAKLLGDRVGRLDTLLGKGEHPALGIERSLDRRLSGPR